MNDHLIKETIKQHYGLEVNSMVSTDEGITKSLILETNEGKFILKLVLESFKETMSHSLNVLLYLESMGFESPRVKLSLSGDAYIDYENQSIVLYKYIESGETVIDYSCLGDLVGRLHACMKSYDGELISQDKHFFIDRYIKLLELKDYNVIKLNKYRKLGDFLWHKVKDLPRSYCHGDLHLGNILHGIDKNYILDFDTSCMAFSMYDVMVLCNATDYFSFNVEALKETQMNYACFMSTYSNHNDVSEVEMNCFYYLIGVYHFQLQATILEIHGLDCVDYEFINRQLNWLYEWMSACEELYDLDFSMN